MIHLQLPGKRSVFWQRAVLPCLTRFFCAFLLAAARIGDEPLPLGLCFFTPLSGGLFGLCAFFGLTLSSFLFFPLRAALEESFAALLVLCARRIFQGTELLSKRSFLPAVAALSSALFGVLLQLSLGAEAAALLFLLGRVVLCFFGAMFCAHFVAPGRREGVSALLGCLVFSAACIPGTQGALGVLLGVYVSLCAIEPATDLRSAALSGAALDLTRVAPGCSLCALLCLTALLGRLLRPRHRALPAAAACLLLLAFCALSRLAYPALLLGGVPGAALSLLGLQLHTGQQKQARTQPGAQRKLQQAANLLDGLSTRLLQQLPEAPAAEPALIFDRAADRVCKGCALFSSCWGGACEAYDALCGAAEPMLARGAVLRDDFPVSFLARCRHLDALLAAINQELDGILSRRQFRHRLSESRCLFAGQYRVFANYLRTLGQTQAQTPRPRARYIPRIGVATSERRGSPVSGDRGASFRTAQGMHYILLCDGMGSGEEARQESTACVMLLRGLLTAGFAPADALQLLNSVYLLRDDGAFATVDLLQIDLVSGALTLFKWGSAPSFLKHGDTLQKIETALPPPGLEGTGKAESFALSLEEGEMLVLLSDGAEGRETEEKIRTFGGRSPKRLASEILQQLQQAEDDRTAVVLRLQSVSSRRQNTTLCRS